MVKDKTKQIKTTLKQMKNKMMRISHQLYLKARKLPILLRNTIAIIFLVVGGVFLTNPLLPGWLLILVGVGIFLPGVQYKYVGRHFKSEKIKKVENDVAKKIEQTLKTNPKWYHRYKTKIKNIGKYFRKNMNK